jgi:hypothetical protein
VVGSFRHLCSMRNEMVESRKSRSPLLYKYSHYPILALPLKLQSFNLKRQLFRVVSKGLDFEISFSVCFVCVCKMYDSKRFSVRYVFSLSFFRSPSRL